MMRKITIIGLGLMGGSLAAACKKKFPRATICGVTRNRTALNYAFRRQWIDQATLHLDLGVKDADLIVLCTPVDTLLPYLRKIDRFCKKGALVTDVGSVKALLQKKINSRKWKNLSFVSCHPMVGSHERGIQAVDPSLYQGGLLILIRDSRTCAASFNKIKKFWGHFSQKLVTLTPDLHDKLIGEISHLPHAVSACLVRAVSPQAMAYASAGFRDVTRIAASSSSIWQPIFKANRSVILKGLKRFERELKVFKRKLLDKNPAQLMRFLDQAQKKRQTL